MKGCAWSLLLPLIGLAVLVAAVFAGLDYWYGVRFADAIGIALLAGFLAWIAVSLLFSAAKALRERAAMIAGMGGAAPVDGRQTYAVGFIQPLGPPLTAPLSGRPCVAYTFEVWDWVGQGRRRTKTSYVDGVAVTPSVIVTTTGSVRLLAGPELDLEEDELDRAESLRHAAELMRTTPFEPPPPAFTRPSIEQRWSDTDGEYRRHTRRIEQDVNLTTSRMSERHLAPNTRVCVVGPWSASQRAIIANPNDWSQITRILKGDPEAIASQLRASSIRRVIGAIIFASASAGALYIYVSSLV